MNIVVNPDVLFVSSDQWNDDIQRDEFLQRTIDILNYIDSINDFNICWNDDYECLLWEAPIQHPWFADRDFRIPLVQILRNKLQKKKIEIEDSLIYDPCVGENDYHLATEALCMLHYCMDEGIEPILWTTEIEIDKSRFSCEHGHKLLPACIAKAGDFWLNGSIVQYLWPNSISDKQRIERLINTYLLFSSKTDHLLYKYSLTNSFVKSIIPHVGFGKDIIQTVSQRLTMTLSEAQASPSIHDEEIKGSGERRIRVTGRPSSTRIHYRFVDNCIEFLHFYGPGEHDDGL